MRPPAEFPVRIGRRAGLWLAVIVGAVLLVGGVSLLSARAISLGTQQIKRQYEQIQAMEAFHGTIHHFISGIQQSMATGEPHSEDQRRQVLADLQRMLGEHADRQAREQDYPEREREISLLRQIGQTLAELGVLPERIMAAGAAGRRPEKEDLRRLAGIEGAVHGMALGMSQVHQVKIGRLLEASDRKMQLIVAFYLAFVLIGGALIAAGSTVFSRTIASPLRRLAAATQDLAAGDLKRRVPVTSRDEIGQLSHSFNAMAERLQEHERRMQSLAVVEERERLAREMHDGLAQSLGYLLLKVRSAAELMGSPSSPRAAAALAEAEKITAEAFREVRQSIFGLRTMVTRSLGLVPTLAEYLHDFSQQSGVAVDLRLGDEGRFRLSPDQEVQLIRIIQEALANVWKHAEARHASVSLEATPEGLEVTIADDGCGFDPAEVRARGRGCFGLQTMEERAAAVGGALRVESAPGKGTRVVAHFPVEA
jgi:signal transduction histidine kinase